MSDKLLDAVTSTGVSSEIFSLYRDRQLFNNHTVSVSITGAPSAVTIDIEGTIDDGATWHQLVQHPFSAGELTATTVMFHFTNKVVDKIRHNLTTLTGGTAPTVTSYHSGY